MPPPEIPASSNGPYQDRKTGLVVFGVMTLLIGLACAMFVPLMLIGLSMGPKQDMRAILPAISIYGVLAVVFVWLGIGSMKARRWARALLLILSWVWMVMGVFSLVFMAVLLPRMIETMKADVPAGQTVPPFEVFMWVPMVFMFVIMVIIPGVWVLFYRSPHVKATCEAEDPVERWTDRCPLPVLAISIGLASTVPSVVFAVAYKGVIPFFGSFLVGPAGIALYVLIAALWAYSAWAMYRLRWSGWWIVTVSIVLFAVSAFLTYSRHDVMELYDLMGYPAEQIAMMKKYNFMNGPAMAWMSVAMVVPFLGYLMFVRRYFAAASAR